MLDRVVNALRHLVERALPWFDQDAYRAESARQDASIAEVRASNIAARRAMAAYRRAHELRRR